MRCADLLLDNQLLELLPGHSGIAELPAKAGDLLRLDIQHLLHGGAEFRVVLHQALERLR